MIVKIFLAVALLVGVSFIYQSVRDTRREIDTLEGWTRHSASVAPVSVRWTAS